MGHGQVGLCLLHSGHPHAEPTDLQPQKQRCERVSQEVNGYQIIMLVNVEWLGFPCFHVQEHCGE